MKVINPVGRHVSTKAEASFDMRACMCAGSHYDNMRGNGGNSCAWCGCSCNGNSAANRSTAQRKVTY